MFTDLLRQVLKLANDNKAKFIFGIFSNWYLFIIGAGVSAAYYVLKGLQDAGILDRVQNFIFPIITNSVLIAKDCTPLILSVQKIYKCVQDHTIPF
jgi:hypothetical protein